MGGGGGGGGTGREGGRVYDSLCWLEKEGNTYFYTKNSLVFPSFHISSKPEHTAFYIRYYGMSIPIPIDISRWFHELILHAD